MGSTTTTKQVQGRKATFLVTKVNNQRVFTPVNRRAHVVTRKAGKRTKVTVADLKKLQGSGSYRYYFYTADGKLRKIQL